MEQLDTTKETVALHSPTPWHYCGAEAGGCKCCMIFSHSDGSGYSVATAEHGVWGDTWPALRFVDNEGKPTSGSSVAGAKVEAYMEMMEYGEVPIEVAKANVRFIVQACNAHDKLLAAAKRAAVVLEFYPPEKNQAKAALEQLWEAIASALTSPVEQPKPDFKKL